MDLQQILKANGTTPEEARIAAQPRYYADQDDWTFFEEPLPRSSAAEDLSLFLSVRLAPGTPQEERDRLAFDIRDAARRVLVHAIEHQSVWGDSAAVDVLLDAFKRAL